VGGSTPQTIRYAGSNPGLTDGTPPSFSFDEQSGHLKARDFFLNGQTTGGFLDALGGQFAILSVPNMALTLRFLNEDRDAEFLANPRVVTSNNQKAEIKITRAQPVPQLNFNEQTAQAVFSGFQDKEFGNTLIVTPVINRNGFISMNVKPEISNKVGDASFTFAGATVTSPIIDKRTLDSNVLIKSGDTLAIGGLLQDESTKGRTKVPVLGDIPIIGYAFQERTNNRTKRNLLVFVTPTIIKQGYGTGLEDQVGGLHNSGEEYADPNGWRNNARGAARLVPTSNRSNGADYPAPGTAPAPRKISTRVTK
jgi:general secretion pathway protein D